MSVCFIASGPRFWGSARMRAYWPAEYIDGARVIEYGEPIPAGYDAYVFQKYITPELARACKEGGSAVWWDLCDPLWWFSPVESRETLEVVDGVAVSSVGLADDFERWCGQEAVVIPDRLKLEHYPRQAEHTWHRPVRLVWFGLGANRMALYATFAVLHRLVANGHEFSLTIYDDRPNEPFRDIEGMFPVYYTRWTLDGENDTLAAHDIALLPPYPGPWGRVKSNNRQLTAWACGLPVADGQDFEALRALICDVQLRRERAERGLRAVQEWHVRKTADDWLEVLA